MTRIEVLSEEDFVDFETDLATWLAREAESHHLSYLLAHTDDGVIWGRIQDGQWILSSTAFEMVAVPLLIMTLQQIRLFGPTAELLLWQTEQGFQGRRCVDVLPNAIDVIDEPYLLWGRATSNSQNGFTLMAEGEQGLYHAVPYALSQGQQMALHVRHYISYDLTGQAYIHLSRLVDLNPVQGGK